MDAPATPCTPQTRYQNDLKRQDFEPNVAQADAVGALQTIYEQLVQQQSSNASFLTKILPGRKKQPVQGLYLWGPVGRGKTYLMDCFYDCLPFPEKRRLHFHHFMREVHAALKARRHQRDPLALVARDWRRDARIICFDEFFVDDIADAMLLANLLRALFAEGVTLVATSNTLPDALYAGSLQRARFLPAIELLKQHTRVMYLGGETDYRLRNLQHTSTYYIGHQDDELNERFRMVTGDSEDKAGPLVVEGREIPTRRFNHDVVWFDFNAICEGPRSFHDYIEIARRFQVVFISNIPQLDDNRLDATRRLIALIDELYDRKVKLIVSASAPPEGLYTSIRLSRPFERTKSRLHEMQTQSYGTKSAS